MFVSNSTHRQRESCTFTSLLCFHQQSQPVSDWISPPAIPSAFSLSHSFLLLLRYLSSVFLSLLVSSQFSVFLDRHPWTFIATKGDTSSVVEDHAVYQGKNVFSRKKSINVPGCFSAPYKCQSFTGEPRSKWCFMNNIFFKNWVRWLMSLPRSPTDEVESETLSSPTFLQYLFTFKNIKNRIT